MYSPCTKKPKIPCFQTVLGIPGAVFLYFGRKRKYRLHKLKIMSKWRIGKLKVIHIFHRVVHRETGENPCKPRGYRGACGKIDKIRALSNYKKWFTEHRNKTVLARRKFVLAPWNLPDNCPRTKDGYPPAAKR